MTVRLPLSRHALPRAVILAVCVAMIPLPAAAGDSTTAPSKNPAVDTSMRADARPLQTAIAKVDSRELKGAAPARTAARRADQGQDVGKESAGFFRTGAGIAVLAVIGVGVGYALYSTSHDRIHSAGKG